MKSAILISGGMDSIAISYWLRPSIGINIDYGQRAATAERRASIAVCEALGIQHVSVDVDLRALGSGDLAGSQVLTIGSSPEWWPFRNQMLITLAAMKCVAVSIQNLIIGTLKTDSFHVDGSETFVEQMNQILKMQEGNLTLSAPAIDMTASELIVASGIPDEILCWAHSCHVANFACGQCRGCEKHYQTLKDLGRGPY
jgi:7-cyano-7-deazaguanine synthase